jgi:hypothetical protein
MSHHLTACVPFMRHCLTACVPLMVTLSEEGTPAAGAHPQELSFEGQDSGNQHSDLIIQTLVSKRSTSQRDMSAVSAVLSSPRREKRFLCVDNNNDCHDKLAYAGQRNSFTLLRALLVLHDRGILAQSN